LFLTLTKGGIRHDPTETKDDQGNATEQPC
jgi:hypothetical protein